MEPRKSCTFNGLGSAKGSLLFGGAKCRFWPIATFCGGATNGRFRGRSEHGADTPNRSFLTHLRHRSAFFSAMQKWRGIGTMW
jgi:hypothetical protein